jgi:Flp pilus assembly protein TadD
MTTLHPDLVTAFRAGDFERAHHLAEQQLRSGSSSPELQYILGLIYCRQGRFEDGIDALRRAVQGDPDNHSFKVMLVRALIDSGRAEEALRFATPPSGMSAAELALWHARAEAADKVGSHAIAAEAWKVLCTARATDWRAWNNLGEAFASLQRWKEAADALRRACELNSQQTQIRRNLAAALAHAGSYEESASEFQWLVDAQPDDAALRLALARVLADLGREQDAMAELERAAALTLGHATQAADTSGYIGIALGREWCNHDRAEPRPAPQIEAVRHLALLFERTNRTDALRQLVGEAERIGIAQEELGYAAAALALRDGHPDAAKRLLAREPQSNDPVRWHRLMSKIFDTLGDAAGAFAEADAMNRAVYDFDKWRSRGGDYRSNLRRLADAITESWVDALPRLGQGARTSPIFLVGFPRSGTTLLDTFLMGHSEAEVVEEMHMLGATELVLGRVTELPQKSMPTLEQARDAYFAELDRHVDDASHRRVVDKLPLNMLGLPVIYSLFPDAKVIFAQRHPCDCVLSGFMQSFVMNDAMACFLAIQDAADLYDAVMDVFARSRNLLPLNLHTLVYEELVSDPEAALRPLVEFLGFEWDDRMLDHRATARERGAIITPSYDQVVQPLNKKPSGRWRRYEKQLESVLPLLLPWAARLGYSD